MGPFPPGRRISGTGTPPPEEALQVPPPPPRRRTKDEQDGEQPVKEEKPREKVKEAKDQFASMNDTADVQPLNTMPNSAPPTMPPACE